MTLKSFLSELERQWAELTDGLWSPDPVGALTDKMQRLEASLPRRYERLARQRAAVEALRERLAENEKRLAHLAERVEVYLHVADRKNSWTHALELDQTRRAIEKETLEVRESERIYQGQVAEIERVKRRLAQLREKIHLQKLARG